MEDHRPWNRMEDEPLEWFVKFQNYFLPLGPTRTLLRAYKAYLAVEDSDRLEERSEDSFNSAPHNWSERSEEWQWRERALAYDELMYSDGGRVELAIAYLKNHALDATEALTEALTNPRTRVQAANSILDRAGVPAVSRHQLFHTSLTSDDLAKAAEELEEWEQKKSSG